jgi:hypothetical protein
LASISTHFFVTSAGFAEKVFIGAFRERGNVGRTQRPNLGGFLENHARHVNVHAKK